MNLQGSTVGIWECAGLPALFQSEPSRRFSQAALTGLVESGLGRPRALPFAKSGWPFGPLAQSRFLPDPPHCSCASFPLIAYSDGFMNTAITISVSSTQATGIIQPQLAG